jgi:hypothetical protein
MFCLKSYYSLFTNLSINPDHTTYCQKSEMAYFMLDLLFLIGDPKKSLTLLDDPVADGHYTVGETIRPRNLKRPRVEEPFAENRVRIDRTSQLLVSLSITIAEYVKMYHLRNKDEKREEKIR